MKKFRRTIIELSEYHREMLYALALKRGWRGYSKIFQEAIDFYLNYMSKTRKEKMDIIKLKGIFKKEEIKNIKKNIKEVRENWRK